MAGRGSSGKTTKRSGTSTRTSKRTSRRKTTRKQQPRSTFEVSLRPEHQRELFALALITLALVTVIFFITGRTGGVGSIYLLGVQQTFGSGALIVPLALGVLGIVILLQEKLQESSFSGSSVVGTILVLSMLLALLEFPVHDIPLAVRTDAGGGMVGYTLVYLLDATIGRPAALIVVIMLTLAGILLTFNITLRELVPGMARWLHKMWLIAWGGTRRSPQEPSAEEETTALQRAAFEPADMVLTPIAERPTRASLFRRADSDEAKQQPAPKPATPPGKEEPASGETSSPPATSSPISKPATVSPKDEQNSETAQNGGLVQERFEDMNVPSLHLAWPMPSIDMLDKPTEGIEDDHDHLTRLARLIEETLGSFKVEAQVTGVNTGPVITQFELQPGVGVKISKITTLEKDLALALAAPSIRIEAPIPGKSAVGIEIPNSAISVVTLHEVIVSDVYEANKGKLKIPLGKDVSGIPKVADMTKMPHLLVAGSTGSGKSVAINSFLCGLLLKHTPDELRIIMVDPKMVELIVYNRVPHLLSPVVTELERVVPTLKWATREMERRYKVFARHGCRNLESYQKRVRTRTDLEPMPYILIVIDELADLMMMAPDEVETQICRLAQMARATGIHLIIATQRPSVDVITGLIKANFPSRVAFAVTSQVDSRVILDTPGAERLLGRGDMLYMAADSAKLVRMQGTYVSDTEVERLVKFWRDATPPEHKTGEKEKQPGEQASRDTQMQQQASESEHTATSSSSTLPVNQESASSPQDEHTPGAYLSTEEQETLLPQAMDLVKQHKRASASLLQRRLRIGYSKAAQLIDLLEEQGIVGPADSGRSREVILPQNDEV
jgi:S-DNA-T family DNA segregation ATPase FtsK/SpoIIIE